MACRPGSACSAGAPRLPARNASPFHLPPRPHATVQPPRFAPLSTPQLPGARATLDAIVTKLNNTAIAVRDTVALKDAATVDPAALKFRGEVTCFVDDATGLVAGLQVGASSPLCDVTKTARSFTVPADSYIASIKVAVAKNTSAVGQIVFTIKSNSTLLPTNVVSCGTAGGAFVATPIMPALSAFASASATCSAETGFIDAVSLRVVVTTKGAASGCSSDADCAALQTCISKVCVSN